MPKVLIITATHGDEGFSIPIVQKLSQTYRFDWIIGNPRALQNKTRYIDQDLNRVAPGNADSNVYEVKRAQEVIEYASTYEFVIDIHGTVSKSGVFVILSDPNWQNIELAKKINLKNVVLWPSMNPNGPLTQFIPNSLEIECGPKDAEATQHQLESVLTDFFEQKYSAAEQSFFIVTGQLQGQHDLSLKDFCESEYNRKNFYPLLVDQYPGIKCYCMQQLENTLSYTNTKG